MLFRSANRVLRQHAESPVAFCEFGELTTLLCQVCRLVHSGDGDLLLDFVYEPNMLCGLKVDPVLGKTHCPPHDTKTNCTIVLLETASVFVRNEADVNDIVKTANRSTDCPFQVWVPLQAVSSGDPLELEVREVRTRQIQTKLSVSLLSNVISVQLWTSIPFAKKLWLPSTVISYTFSSSGRY